MKRLHQRNCKNCNELFLPDRRNLRHQTYCSKPLCRQASKKDSQRRWLAKSGNRDYFRGPAHVWPVFKRGAPRIRATGAAPGPRHLLRYKNTTTHKGLI